MKRLIIYSFTILAFLYNTSCDLQRIPTDSLPVDYTFETIQDIRTWSGLPENDLRAIASSGVSLPLEIMAGVINVSADYGNNYGDFERGQFFTSDGTISGIWTSRMQKINEINFFMQSMKDNMRFVPTEEEKLEINVLKGKSLFIRALCNFGLAQLYCPTYADNKDVPELGLPLTTVWKKGAVPKRSSLKETFDFIKKDLDEAKAEINKTYDIADKQVQELENKLNQITTEKKKLEADYPNEKDPTRKKEIVQKYNDLDQILQRETPKYRKLVAQLNEIGGKPGSNFITKDVLTAFEARVALWMEDYETAYKCAKELIQSGKYQLINTQKGLIKMWLNDLGQEVIYQGYQANPDELTFTLGGSYMAIDNANKARNWAEPNFIPNNIVLNAYEPNDMRKAVYFDNSYILTFDQKHKFGGIYIVSKYRGNPALQNSAESNYDQAPKYFRVAEMYLIAAEAGLKLGKGGEAKKYLDDLRKARGVKEIDLNEDNIFEERKREFAYEGYLFLDMKRLGKEIHRTVDDCQAPAYNEGKKLYVDYDTTTKSYTLEKYRYTWPIPATEKELNPNLKQNPGW